MDSPKAQSGLTGYAKFSEKVRREMFDPEAARGADSTLWKTMEGSFGLTAKCYGMSSRPIQSFEWEIHDTWYMFIQSAKNIDAHHPAQDRLTRLILGARELGVVTRTRKRSQVSQLGQSDWIVLGEESERAGEGSEDRMVQEAATSDGCIWVDLPFLVQDLRAAWTEAMAPTTSAAHRCNLAAAIARLAGLGICDDALSACGLSIMRETLEQPRLLRPAPVHSDANDHDGAGTIGTPQFAITELLPIVYIWLRYAGHKLLRLCEGSRDDLFWSPEDSSPGELAREAGVESQGFSGPRYSFWRAQLEQLSAGADDNDLETALHSSRIINSIWKEYFGKR